MEDLSRAAGITKSSFYHHVSGKEELLRAALERALDGLFAILDERHAATGRAVDRLRYIVRRQVEVLQAELPYVTLLLRVRGNTETERWALDRRRDVRRGVADLVREAVEAGQMRADVDPAVAARLLSGTVNSIVEWYRPDRPRPAAKTALPEDVVPRGVRGVLAGGGLSSLGGCAGRLGRVIMRPNEHSVGGGGGDRCRAGRRRSSPPEFERTIAARPARSSRATGCPTPTARR